MHPLFIRSSTHAGPSDAHNVRRAAVLADTLAKVLRAPVRLVGKDNCEVFQDRMLHVFHSEAICLAMNKGCVSATGVCVCVRKKERGEGGVKQHQRTSIQAPSVWQSHSPSLQE